MDYSFVKTMLLPQVNGRKGVLCRSFLVRFHSLALGWLLLSFGGARAEEAFSKTEHGVLLHFGQATIELATAGPEVLRLSVCYDHQLQPSPSSFLVKTNGSDGGSWTVLKEDGFVGIQTKAGRLLMNPDDGEWTLQTRGGETLIPKHKIGDLNHSDSGTNQSIHIQLGWEAGNPIAVYGSGNGITNLEHTEARSGVWNGGAAIPYYWSKAGYAVLAVTSDDNHPARWHGMENKEFLTWTFPGARADLYLIPAPSLKDAARTYAHLTGAAPVPPEWAFGYLQSRWGWTNRAYIEDTLKRFQDLKIPVDAFIYDFEWYTPKPDYELPDSGKAGFEDFGWNPTLFPDAMSQINSSKAQGVRFVGIRKPRLGNDEFLKMARAKKWDLHSQGTKNVPARDLNFADPSLREWYSDQSADLLKAGVDGWWNDEGEATYTTYFYWNQAERIAMDRFRGDARLWTLNRAFSPGTQRYGAAAWTGDIVSSWNNLAVTPTHLLNWGLAGMPCGACDIGGFFGSPSDELMSRWMEAGVFFPIMRTHSEIHYQPHFPWLYGAEALDAMRKAIDLRYRLIPYYYSLAHGTFENGAPWMRPLVMEFPDDPRVANLSDEWLMGSSLLAAPVLKEGGKRSIYLPASDWYVFGTNTILKGSRSLEVDVALDEIPVYVRAGTILPLGPIIQHTSELPGGPLELQVYPGKDATFTLIEDDGETQDYSHGKIRSTVFTWNDHKRQLKWKRTGNYSGKNVFQKIRVKVFNPKGDYETTESLTSSGSIQAKPQVTSGGSAFGNSRSRNF
jgi:alpha-glucosidase